MALGLEPISVTPGEPYRLGEGVLAGCGPDQGIGFVVNASPTSVYRAIGLTPDPIEAWDTAKY